MVGGPVSVFRDALGVGVLSMNSPSDSMPEVYERRELEPLPALAEDIGKRKSSEKKDSSAWTERKRERDLQKRIKSIVKLTLVYSDQSRLRTQTDIYTIAG